MFQRWYRLFFCIVISQFVWAAAFLSAPSSWIALGLPVGIVCAGAILIYPQVGALLLSSLLIGQWPWNIISYLGALTFASAAAWLLIHKLRLFPNSAILWITSLFFLVGLASVIYPSTSIDLRSQIITLGAHCAIVWLFVTVMSNRKMLLLSVRLMVLSGIITALIGLVQWRTHFVWIASTTHSVLEIDKEAFRDKSAFDLQQWRGQFRIDSITGTPDFLPLYMQSLTPFVGFWIVRQKALSLRILGLVILALFALAHVLSYTRGALLSTAVVLFLLAWVIDRKRLLFYGPIVTLIGAMAMMSWGPWRDRLVSMIDLSTSETADRVNTGAWRLRTIPVAIQLIGERPLLGVGLGQQRWNWPEYTIGDLIPDPKLATPPPIHNDFLLIAVEVGVGGLILVVALVFTALTTLYRLATWYEQSGDFELADLSRGTMLALIGLAAAMSMYPIVENFRYFWLLLGLAAALSRIQVESKESLSTIPSHT